MLESGCHGNAVVVAPNILPMLSKIPTDLFPDNERFLEDFFNCFRSGWVGCSDDQKLDILYTHSLNIESMATQFWAL